MDHTLWTVIQWSYFLLDIVGLGVVANWPFLPGKNQLMGFFSIYIFCTIANFAYTMVSNIPFIGSNFYTILGFLRLFGMLLLILGLIEIGKKISPDSINKNDPDNF